MGYQFNGQPITDDQANNIKQIAMLGQARVLSPSTAASSLVSTLLQKPNNFQNTLTSYLGGGQQQAQQPQQYTNADYIKNQSAPRTPAPTPTPQAVLETPGTFGFGTAPGQLFGTGGLVANLTQPFRQGIINPIAQAGQSILKGGLNTADVGNQQNQLENLTKQAQYAFSVGDKNKGNTLLNQARGLQSGVQQQVNSAGAANPNNAVQNQTPFAVTQQEANDYNSNPLLGGIKSGFGIASYAVPIGKAANVAGAIGLGGLAGGAFGFGTSRPGEELNNTLAGGVGGGLTAGALKFAQPLTSRIGNAINGVGENLKNNILEVNPTKLKYSQYSGVTGAKQLEADTLGVLKSLGENPVTKQQAAQAIDRSITGLQQQVGEQAANSNKLFDTGSIIDNVKAIFKNNPKIIADNQEPILNLMDLGNKVNASDLSKYYFDIQNQINFNRSTGAAPEAERLLRALQDTIGSELKNPQTGVSGLSKTLDQLHILHEAQPFATTNAFKGVTTGGGIPIISKVNVAPATDRVQTYIGRILGNTPTINGPALQNTLPRLGAYGSIGQSLPQLGQQTSQSNNGTNQYGTFEIPQAQNNYDPQLQSILMRGVLNGDISASDAKAYSDLLGQGSPNPKPLSVTDQQKVDAAKQGIQELNTISQLYNTGTTLQGGLPAFLQSNSAQQLDQAIQNAMDMIARSRTGAVINPSEMTMYRNMFPVPGDTPETTKSKLQRIYNELAGVAQLGN